MHQYKNSGLPVVPLYYSVPLLAVCVIALLILVFVFGISVPGVYLQAPPNPITTCGQLTQNDVYYTLTANLVFSGGNCLTVIGNNSVVDSNNQYTITGNNNAGDIAVFVVGHNVTLRRLNITNSDIGILVSGANGTNITLSHINNSIRHAVYLNVSNESKIIQNILSYPAMDGVLVESSLNGVIQGNIIIGRETLNVPGTSLSGIELNNSRQNNIFNNSVFNFARGAAFQNSRDNIFRANIFNSPSLNGLYFNLNNGNNYFNHDKIIGSQRSAVLIDKTGNATFLNLSIINTVSPYYDLEAITMPTGVQLIDTHIARYVFNTTIVVFRNTGNAWINFTQGLNGTSTNLSADVKLGFNYVDVNSVQRPELNRSAVITLQGLSSSLTNPTVYRNGQVCPSSVCVNLTSLNANTVVFSVTGWTNYSIVSGTAVLPQMIIINEPDSNDVYSQSNFPVSFDVDLNQTGKAWFSLNNGSTNTSMNTDDNISFNYLQSALSSGNYTFTAYANFTGTTQTAKAFVNFRVSNGSVSPPPPGTPTVSVDEPDANDIYYLNSFPVIFIVDLSQAGKAWFSLNNGVTNITMSNSSVSNTRFTYSQTALSFGNYTFTAYANFTGTTQRDSETVSFRVLSSSQPPNGTIILNNTNSTNLPGASGSVEFKYVAYWLVIAILSIAIIILVMLIIKYFRTRDVTRNTVPMSIVSQLR